MGSGGDEVRLLHQQAGGGLQELQGDANPFKHVGASGRGVHKLQAVDVDDDGYLELLVGTSNSMYLELYKIDRQCEIPNACAGLGRCLSTGECRCLAGHTLQDCTGCSSSYATPGHPCPLAQDAGCAAYWGSHVKVAHVLADTASRINVACPGEGQNGGVCSRRGPCHDDLLAKMLVREADPGVSSVTLLRAVGSSLCLCPSPFSGHNCEVGECPAGIGFNEVEQLNLSNELLGGLVRRIRDDALRIASLDPSSNVWQDHWFGERLQALDMQGGYTMTENTIGQKFHGCKACSKGFYKSEQGNFACEACEVGRFQRLEGRTACEVCPLGRFENAAGSSECDTCSAGSVATALGSIGCQACPVGRYVQQGGTDCKLCKAGQFAGSPGSTECQACPVGRVARADGSADCEECPVGRFAEAGGASCGACPAGQLNYAVRVVDLPVGGLGCACMPGFFFSTASSTQTGACLKCMEGVLCPGGLVEGSRRLQGGNSSRKHAPPVALPGFYLIDPSRAAAVECELEVNGESACLGGTDMVCKEGHKGPLCESCDSLAEPRAREISTDPCTPCSDNPPLAINLLGIIGGSFLNGAWFLVLASLSIRGVAKQKSSVPVLLRIVQSFFFSMSVLSTFDLSKVPLFEWSMQREKTLASECELMAATAGEDGSSCSEGLEFSFPEAVSMWFQEMFKFQMEIPRPASPDVTLLCWDGKTLNSPTAPAIYWAFLHVPLLHLAIVILALSLNLCLPKSVKSGATKALSAQGQLQLALEAIQAPLLKQMEMRGIDNGGALWETLMEVLGKATPEEVEEWKAAAKEAAAGNVQAAVEKCMGLLREYPELLLPVLRPAGRKALERKCQHDETVSFFCEKLDQLGPSAWQKIFEVLLEEQIEVGEEDVQPALHVAILLTMLKLEGVVLELWRRSDPPVAPLGVLLVRTHDLGLPRLIEVLRSKVPIEMLADSLGPITELTVEEKAPCDNEVALTIPVAPLAKKVAGVGASLGPAALASGKEEEAMRFLGIFRERPEGVSLISYARMVSSDAVPVNIYALYGAFPVLLQNYLKFVHCDNLHEALPGQRWRLDTEITCYQGVHLPVAILAFAGMAIWIIGVVVGLFLKLWHLGRARMTEKHLQTFGYFFVGLEPQFWWWELLVKRSDVMLVNVIAYTNLMDDVRGKLIFYTILSGLMLSVHNYYKPYDNRSGMLADILETFALNVRFMVFGFVLVLLLVNSRETLSFIIGWMLLFAVILFLAYALLQLPIEILSGLESEDDEEPPENMNGMIKTVSRKLPSLGFQSASRRAQQYVHHHKEHDVLKVQWRGPGTGASLQGADDSSGRGGLWSWRRSTVRWFFRLRDSHQRGIFKGAVGEFAKVLMGFEATASRPTRVPANLTDLLLLFALASARCTTGGSRRIGMLVGLARDIAATARDDVCEVRCEEIVEALALVQRLSQEEGRKLFADLVEILGESAVDMAPEQATCVVPGADAFIL